MSGSEVTEYVAHQEVCPAGTVRRGATTLVTGCMFSGKTTLLIDALSLYPADQVLAVRHRIDDRYRTDAIVSHDGRSFPARTIGCARDLLTWRNDPPVRLFVIDEVHFLDESLWAVTERIARSGCGVMMAGLDRDSWGRPFPHMVRLSQDVDRTIRCTGVCGQCGGTADRTQRLTPIVDGRMVGGPESYDARCIRCWTPPP